MIPKITSQVCASRLHVLIWLFHTCISVRNTMVMYLSLLSPSMTTSCSGEQCMSCWCTNSRESNYFVNTKSLMRPTSSFVPHFACHLRHVSKVWPTRQIATHISMTYLLPQSMCRGTLTQNITTVESEFPESEQNKNLVVCTAAFRVHPK